ncbi:hypothetical protein ES703_68888 [subsurface metagenome]
MRFLLLTILLICLTLAGCMAGDIWGRPVEEVRFRIRYSDYSFLRHLDISRKNRSQVFKLGPGAAYYFYFILQDLGFVDSASGMLRLQWDKGGGIWKEEAGLIFLADILKKEDYPLTERLAGQMLPRMVTHSAKRRCERLLLEALYWQKKDSELLKRLDSFELDEEEDAELKLFRAVSSCRLDLEDWQDHFKSLFLAGKSSSLHTRALSFLELGDRHRAFSENDFSIFRARSLLYTGKAEQALEILEERLPDLDRKTIDLSILIGELGAAYFESGDLARGAEYLSGLAENLESAGRLGALEYAGRLYRKLGLPEKALALLNRVITESPDPEQKDRAIWFFLDLIREHNREDFLKELERLAGEWVNPNYFSDLLEEEIALLLARRKWAGLQQFYRVLADSGPDSTRPRLAYLMGRLKSLNLLPIEEGGPAPEAFYREAGLDDADGYYGWLSAALLEENQSIYPPAASTNEDYKSLSETEELIWGFFEFGQHLRGYRRLWAGRHLVNHAFLLKAARELHYRELFLESIRLVNAYLSQGKERSAALLKLQYPRGYLADIEDIAGRENIPGLLLYALVREESYFDPDIVSRAGAVGLSQLMPETAGDMARLLKIEQIELTDARLNLRLGARHLSRLLARLDDSVPKALMAYNAGLSRLRAWERSFPDLPGDLLVEAAPFRETRQYVRKILVSNIYYGYLYQDISPKDSVFLFFPELKGQR